MEKDFQINSLKDTFEKEKEESLKFHLNELQSLKIKFDQMQQKSGSDLESERRFF